MNQDRKRHRDDEMPNRSSNMEQAEGSRESSTDAESMRNRRENDLGTSSDRAMFDEPEAAEERDTPSSSSTGGRSGSSSRERRRGNGGGITNRPLDREQREQERVPARGRSHSDSER